MNIVEEPYEQLLDDLRAGDIDVLFSVLRCPDWATRQVKERILFEEPYVIVMRPKHPLSALADIGRDQLADYDWIVPGRSTASLPGLRTLVFASARKLPTASVSTASRGLIRSLITTSDRLTLLTNTRRFLRKSLACCGLQRRGFAFRAAPMVSRRAPIGVPRLYSKLFWISSSATPG